MSCGRQVRNAWEAMSTYYRNARKGIREAAQGVEALSDRVVNRNMRVEVSTGHF